MESTCDCEESIWETLVACRLFWWPGIGSDNKDFKIE